MNAIRNTNQFILNLPRQIKTTNRRRHGSHTTIHVNIRSTRNKSIDHQNSLHLKTHHQRNKAKKRRNHSNSVKGSENTLSSTSVTKIYPHHQDIIDNDRHPIQVKNAWLKQTDNTIDYHQNVKKKKKCFSQFVKISIFTAVVIGIVITAILLAVLIKPQTATTSISIVELRWNKTGITVAGVGIAGNASNQLNKPLDTSLDHQNSLYIADTNNHRIQKYLMGASNGATVAGNSSGIGGASLNALRYPSQVIIVSNGDMFVTDTYNYRILKWSSGSSSPVVVAGVSGLAGNSSNKLNVPYRIDYDLVSDSLYIADYLNSRVMCYLSGASSGTVVAGGNGVGKNITQLYYPVGIYFNLSSNSLILANHYANNIVNWPIGATSWTLLVGDINGNNGSNATMLTRPTDITFDPMGNMYVVDRNNQRIQLFLSGQTEGITIAGVTGITGSTSTLFNQPWSIELDNQLNFYVADSNNNRIQKFLRY